MDAVRVVVFDVDNTIVKGNLIVRFLFALIAQRWQLIFPFFGLLVHGFYLQFWVFPRLVRRVLKKKDIFAFDRAMQIFTRRFFLHMGFVLKKNKITGAVLRDHAQQIFSREYLQNYIYTQAEQMIFEHLHEENTIVILLSGALQELLDQVFDELCRRIDQAGIEWGNRFFAIGTKLGEKEKLVSPCVGFEKIKQMYALLRAQGYITFELDFVYTDNHHMADLPLLLSSKNGGALIGRKRLAARVLPSRMIKTLHFFPRWEKE